MLTVIMAPTVPNIIIIILTDSEEEAELQSMIKSDEEKNQNVLFDPCYAGGGVIYNSWSECSLSLATKEEPRFLIFTYTSHFILLKQLASSTRRRKVDGHFSAAIPPPPYSPQPPPTTPR